MALTERLLATDLSLVVYYAPWDRESQAVRWEIEKVARYHHEQVRKKAKDGGKGVKRYGLGEEELTVRG